MLFLLPHVHAAVVDDDAVLLDVAEDRYICVPGGRRHLGLTSNGRSLNPPDLGTADALRAAGLVSTGASLSARPRIQPAVRDLREGPRGRFGFSDGLHAMGALTDYWRHYRGRPLPHILAYVRRQGPAQPAAITPSVARLVTVFAAALVWLPVPRKCLVRSFLLLRFLQWSGEDAEWIFGVSTWPFTAHCWLQVGDVVLDDLPERLLGLEPILAA
jgi:hypothetical protein